MSKRDREDIAEMLARRSMLDRMDQMTRMDMPLVPADMQLPGPSLEAWKRQYEMKRLIEETGPDDNLYRDPVGQRLYRPRQVPADQPSSERDENTGIYWNWQL